MHRWNHPYFVNLCFIHEFASIRILNLEDCAQDWKQCGSHLTRICIWPGWLLHSGPFIRHILPLTFAIDQWNVTWKERKSYVQERIYQLKHSKHAFSLNFFKLVDFCLDGNHIQGFIHASQVLYPWVTSATHNAIFWFPGFKCWVTGTKLFLI